ncbi:hypothetical protein CYMTET_32891 [Cymbomonas tetramitiformis]|uniref:Uncharacterized protein n=1 Tax=Cymbomonas tetramitiformis TaxID=36881 RepID=A0AAE0FET8_9CHLO|nr:hypothetical protein CYMTET_32891 [Cymbomonas tetramitiformis]
MRSAISEVAPSSQWQCAAANQECHGKPRNQEVAPPAAVSACHESAKWRPAACAAESGGGSQQRRRPRTMGASQQRKSGRWTRGVAPASGRRLANQGSGTAAAGKAAALNVWRRSGAAANQEAKGEERSAQETQVESESPTVIPGAGREAGFENGRPSAMVPSSAASMLEQQTNEELQTMLNTMSERLAFAEDSRKRAEQRAAFFQVKLRRAEERLHKTATDLDEKPLLVADNPFFSNEEPAELGALIEADKSSDRAGTGPQRVKNGVMLGTGSVSPYYFTHAQLGSEGGEHTPGPVPRTVTSPNGHAVANGNSGQAVSFATKDEVQYIGSGLTQPTLGTPTPIREAAAKQMVSSGTDAASPGLGSPLKKREAAISDIHVETMELRSRSTSIAPGDVFSLKTLQATEETEEKAGKKPTKKKKKLDNAIKAQIENIDYRLKEIRSRRELAFNLCSVEDAHQVAREEVEETALKKMRKKLMQVKPPGKA